MTIRLWEVNIGNEIRLLRDHSNFLNFVAISSGNEYIASSKPDCYPLGSSNNTVILWDSNRGN